MLHLHPVLLSCLSHRPGPKIIHFNLKLGTITVPRCDRAVNKPLAQQQWANLKETLEGHNVEVVTCQPVKGQHISVKSLKFYEIFQKNGPAIDI